ncbi:MAG: hypothetical protein RL341_1240 [Pseudomonadota bacterium]|jgi:hypothetical protein
MHTILRLAAIVLAATALAACATLGGPRTFTLTEAQLNRLMDERMNKSLTFLKLFDVNLANPKIALDQSTSRVITSMDASLKNPFSGNRLSGSAKISGKLNFDPKTNSIVLADTRTEDFKLEGTPVQYTNQINAIGKMVASEFMKDFTVYTLKPEDLKVSGVTYTAGKFEVLRDALSITLNPAK